MGGHVFVDETKQRAYVLAATALPPDELDVVRKIIRTLLLPGQRRLHMKDERDSRRRKILSTLDDAGATATIYNSVRRERSHIESRLACLQALIADVTARDHRMLVLERDDTLVQRDRQALIEYTRAAGCYEELRYEHRRAHEEHLLAIPDAIAWAWSKGGEWRRRARRLITEIRDV